MDGKIVMIKKALITFCFLCAGAFAFSLDECYKIYPVDADSLYMSAISAISSSDKYTISELQSKNGYILFTYGSKYYLLTLTKRYKNQSEIKILPQNSIYSQGSDVAKEIFALIDAQLKNPMELIKNAQ